jgi:hypothetical protein
MPNPFQSDVFYYVLKVLLETHNFSNLQFSNVLLFYFIASLRQNCISVVSNLIMCYLRSRSLHHII